MPLGPLLPWCFAALCALGAHAQSCAEPDPLAPSFRLTVPAGRPLHVRIESQVTVARVGQPIDATVIEPVYAYDRIVIPAGSKVSGHISQLTNPPRRVRAQAMLGGYFSPMRDVTLQFDRLTLSGGRTFPIRTTAQAGTENMTLQVAAQPVASGRVARAREAVTRRVHEQIRGASDVVGEIKSPGKLARVKEILVDRLPYHPQHLRRGTVYDANLLAPLDFGSVRLTPAEDGAALPAPDSIVNVRLVTALDSARDSRGAKVEAVLAAPVFSPRHRLILPEGTVLHGEVTYAVAARHFHRNGQLRFLFERVDVPARSEETMLASLHAAEVSADAHVTIDEEGGATVPNSRKRFIAPAVAYVAMRATGDNDRYDRDRLGGSAVAGSPGANLGGRALGGFSGLGFLGLALSQLSRPVATGLGFYGLAGSVYVAVFGRGSEVRFPSGTRMQLQLAPGPSPQ